jgi:hypothetical protein
LFAMRSDGTGRGYVLLYLRPAKPCHECGLCGVPPQTSTGVPGPVVAEKTSGLATASLIFGIPFLFFPFPIVAVVFGHVSLSQIKKSAGRLGGKGLAIAGLVLGYLGIAMIPLTLIIAAIAIPNLLRARMAANESSALYSLRTINTAQVSYQANFGQKIGYAPDLQSLGGFQHSGYGLPDRQQVSGREQLARQERVHFRLDAF